MRASTGRGNDSLKILRFYRVNYRISAPYRVLCDGPLIHKALQKRLFLKDTLSKLLGDAASAVVTKCIYDELRALGTDFAQAALFARRLTRIPCVHEESSASGADCAVAALHGGNPGKLLLATCDETVLRFALSEVAVPILRYVNDSRIVLLPPSKLTIADVTENERIKSDVSRPDELRLLETEEQKRRLMLERKRSASSRRKKKARAPNPLSVKKSVLTKKTDKATHEFVNVPVALPTQDEQLVRSVCHNTDGESTDCESQVSRKPKRVRKRKPKTAPQNLHQREDFADSAASMQAASQPRINLI